MQLVPEERAPITTQHHCPQHPHHAQPQYRSAEVSLSHYFMEATDFQSLGQSDFIKTKERANNQSNITRECLAIHLHIWEVLGSKFGPLTSYPDQHVS